jgi:predicted RecA/RadA family phage recombinase
MKNFIQDGNVVTAVAGTGGVSSGDVVVEGNLIGVAATDALEGAEYELALTGVYALPKQTGTGIDAGARVWWNSTSHEVEAASSAGLWPIGNATQQAASGDDEAYVRLPGIPVVVEGT